MDDWSLPDLHCPINDYSYASYPSCYQQHPVPRVYHCPPPQAQACLPATPGQNMALQFSPQLQYGSAATDAAAIIPKGENPREIRNKAEKMRRDRLNQSVAELATLVPPVVAARRKIDKTTILRLTAHYLRAHQYVFNDSIEQSVQKFSSASILKVLNLFNGFLITITYRGIVVVVSPNVQQYLGYTELDLLGQNLLNITHEGDRAMLRDQLMTKTQKLGPNGELVIPDVPDAKRIVEEALAQEKRRFVIRLKKLGQRSEPSQYVTCHVEGSLRKSDGACRGYNRCCQVVRRARARSENPCSSGNDIVFVGIVRPSCETFINESALESYRMEYRTRHSIDGEIIQCEARIALVTGYMTHEVSGVNAMNFMHRNDVRWVIIALREMYDQHRLFGESCYRLMTKNGQFIYMRTRGCLDVDRNSHAVTSFVCTNTVVNEAEGRQLIKQMKRKFSVLINSSETSAIEEADDDINDDDIDEDQPAPVEDPRLLEQVILHLVTNLPSPAPHEREDEPFAATLPEKSVSPHRLTIIPPNKERIVSAIEKIYSVIKTFQKDSDHQDVIVEKITDGGSEQPLEYPEVFEENVLPLPQKEQVAPYENSADITTFMEVPESPLEQSIAFNSTNNEYSESILDDVTSPDMGYFDASPISFTDINSVIANFSEICDEIVNEQKDIYCNEINYHEAGMTMNMPMPDYAEESNILQALSQPNTNNYMCGTKRPNDFEDLNVVHKKKNIEYKQMDQNDVIDSTTLDQIFDESIFRDDDIETALKSLDSIIDPTFPELLGSMDVQDVLGKIEKEAEEQRLLDFDLSDYE